jgi:hypothetical protein
VEKLKYKKLQGTWNLHQLNQAPRHEDVGRSGGIALHVNLGARWRWVVIFTLRPLYSRRWGPNYPFDRRLGWPQSWFRRGGEEKESLLRPCWESNDGRPTRNLVTVLTELPRIWIWSTSVIIYLSLPLLHMWREVVQRVTWRLLIVLFQTIPACPHIFSYVVT